MTTYSESPAKVQAPEAQKNDLGFGGVPAHAGHPGPKPHWHKLRDWNDGALIYKDAEAFAEDELDGPPRLIGEFDDILKGTPENTLIDTAPKKEDAPPVPTGLNPRAVQAWIAARALAQSLSRDGLLCSDGKVYARRPGDYLYETVVGHGGQPIERTPFKVYVRARVPDRYKRAAGVAVKGLAESVVGYVAAKQAEGDEAWKDIKWDGKVVKLMLGDLFDSWAAGKSRHDPALAKIGPWGGNLEAGGVQMPGRKGVEYYGGVSVDMLTRDARNVRVLHKTSIARAPDPKLTAQGWTRLAYSAGGMDKARELMREIVLSIYHAPAARGKAIWLLGRTGDGKSSFLDAISAAFPGLAAELSGGAFMESGYSLDMSLPDLARKNARLAVMDDPPGGKKFKESAYKAFVMGKPVTYAIGVNAAKARGLDATGMIAPHQNLIVACNELPKYGEAHDGAILRRSVVFVFRQPTEAEKLETVELEDGGKFAEAAAGMLMEAWDEAKASGFALPKYKPLERWPDLDWAAPTPRMEFVEWALDALDEYEGQGVRTARLRDLLSDFGRYNPPNAQYGVIGTELAEASGWEYAARKKIGGKCVRCVFEFKGPPASEPDEFEEALKSAGIDEAYDE